jgi:hypothetical protein
MFLKTVFQMDVWDPPEGSAAAAVSPEGSFKI